jgi:acyl-ACP thioesterase
LVLPGKSGIQVQGHLEGSELAAPGSLVPKPLGNSEVRTVRFTDLDQNSHMNNCRYLDWVADLLPSAFHEQHPVRDLTVCYLSEAREGEQIRLSWELQEDGSLRLDGQREPLDVSATHGRVFSVQMLF